MTATTAEFEPSYLRLHRSGELARRAAELDEFLAGCRLCPRDCAVDRRRDEIGFCRSGRRAIVSAHAPHLGEEPPLAGTRGVGNIFFANCTMRCAYCQNHEISQNWRQERHRAVTPGRLAEIMLELQGRGCHSIGLVSPTHFLPQVVEALGLAAEGGLRLPLVYNTNAYDAVEALRRLEGVVDIYLPDLKYADPAAAWEYSRTRDYPQHARAAIQEMHRQVGARPVFADGLLRRGLVVRHLVLPNDQGQSGETLRWIREELGPAVLLSVMSQYYPTHRAHRHALLNRPLDPGEYELVLRLVEELGFEEGWIQTFDSPDSYRPDFSDRRHPFG